MSELELVKSMYFDYVAFIQQNLVGYWIVYLIVLLYMILNLNIISTPVDVVNISKPLSKWRIWLIWILGGLWGGHWQSLTPKVPYSHKKFGCDTEFFNSWSVFSGVLVAVVMLLLTFHMFDMQYHVVAVLLLILILVNGLWGFISIPYRVRVFNARWYRCYIETDFILNNKSLPIDEQVRITNLRMTNFGKNLDGITAIIDDSDYGQEDADTSFLKNMITFGNYNRLQREKGRLNMLIETCSVLDEEIERNKNIQRGLERYLEQYRVAAYRNIYLCKELLSLLKKIEGRSQTLVLDNQIYIPQLSDVSVMSISNMKDVMFDTTVFEGYTATSFNNVLETLTDIQNRGEKVTSDDLIVGAIEIGLSAVADSISGIMGMNTEVTNQRAEVQRRIADVTDELECLLPKLNVYKAEILRKVEVLEALKEMCIAFIKLYEPLRKSIYDDDGGFISGYQDFIKSSKTREQLAVLAAICSHYNKFNNIKQ